MICSQENVKGVPLTNHPVPLCVRAATGEVFLP